VISSDASTPRQEPRVLIAGGSVGVWEPYRGHGRLRQFDHTHVYGAALVGVMPPVIFDWEARYPRGDSPGPRL